MLFLLELARSSISKSVLVWVLTHMSFILPVNKLYETERVIAFHHPQPYYPVHILIVPKIHIRKFIDLSQDDQGILFDVLEAVKNIVSQLNLEKVGYRLIVNGGKYQDVEQLHFHLVSGDYEAV